MKTRSCGLISESENTCEWNWSWKGRQRWHEVTFTL